MSKTTAALEAAVAIVIENTPKEGTQTARQRVTADRAFATILKLIAPRIRHFIRQYGLVAHWDDAEQCCAIGVHRAIQAYEPEKAQFTTFVNWQLRGELQSLRFRLMTDQRPSAKKVDATTVSLHAVATGPDGEETSLEALIEDDEALESTEAAASSYLADGARRALIDRYVEHLRATGVEQLKRRARAKKRPVAPIQPGLPRFRSATHGINPEELEALEAKIAQHRLVLERRVFGDAGLDDLGDPELTRERVRQIVKSAGKVMAELTSTDPRFQIMSIPVARSERAKVAPKQVEVAKTSLLPDADAPHNRLARVVALEGADEIQDMVSEAVAAVQTQSVATVH